MENINDVRALIRKANEARQIGLFYDLVPRKHDYSNLILELKSMIADLATLEAMPSSLFGDNIITLIKQKLESGNDLFETLEGKECLITELKANLKQRECQIAQCNKTISVLKSETEDLKKGLNNIDEEYSDRIVSLETFARSAIEYMESVSSSSFLNFSKKDRLIDRQNLDDLRCTFEELFDRL